jgi:CheY-like chemotaxis protein
MTVTDRVIPESIREKINILVVEDNLLSRKLITFWLKKWHFKFDSVANGELAVENLKLNKYDLILMDIQMPGMNGYETVRFIRNEMRLGLPVIAITSQVSEEERQRCLKAGMNDFAPKPLQEIELYNLVINYLFITVVDGRENKDGQGHRSMQNESVEAAKEKNKKVVDLDYLNELSKGDKTFVKEMIALFLSENPEEIKSLETAIADRNNKQIETSAHKLRSTIPFVGLDKVIGEKVCEIEKLAGEKADIKEIESNFVTVKNACEKACLELVEV